MNSGPENHRLFRDAFEWIQFLNIAAAAERGDGSEERKLRNDLVDDLRGLHRENAFSEKKTERIRRLEVGYLENALVDREDDDLAGRSVL